MTVAPEAHPRPPDRPGPGPLPETLLRALDLTIGRRIEGMLAGDHRSSVLGQGSELAQVRPYVPGDDVRRIEWNVTARTGETHVRVDLAERVLVTWLALDVSASMSFGTAERRKADVAEGVALALGHLASRRGNRLGLVAFGDERAQAIPPRAGRAGMLGLLLSLRREPVLEGGGATSLGAALGLVARMAQQRSLVAIVSDFRGPRDWRPPLLQLAGGHDVLAVEIRDPREEALPNVGELRLVDPGDRPPAPRRHREREAARALRGSGSRGAAGDREGALLARRRPRRALDRGRLAAPARAPPPPPRRQTVSFQWPLALLALLAVPLAIFGYVLLERRRHRQAAAFATPALVPNLVGRSPGRLRHLAPALALFALAALAIGLARPHATISVKQEQATVVLAMDTSRSMVATDVPPSRLAVAQQAVRRFLGKLPEDYRVGMVSFAQSAQTVLPATANREAAQAALRNLRTGDGTALGEGIARAIQVAQRVPAEEGKKPPASILVLSDGAQTQGVLEPQAAATRAKKLKIPVYTVAFGTDQGVVEVVDDNGFTQRVTVPPDPPTLRKVSQTTGGRFYAAPDAAQLNAVYEELGSRIGSVKKEREITAGFAAGGAFLLLAAGAVSAFLFGRLP